MKYLIASLVVPAVQIVFLCAFTLFALGIGVSSLIEKLKPKRIPVKASRNKR